MPSKKKPGRLRFRSFIFIIILSISAGLLPFNLRAENNKSAFPAIDYDLLFTNALLHINQKNYLEAIDELNNAIAIKPNDLSASYFLGIALSKLGRNKEAEELLKKTIRLDPNFQMVHFELGVVEYKLGKYSEALTELELAEGIDPKNARLFYYQGLTYHQLGDYRRSSPLFLRAVTMAPELNLTAHYYAGIGFYRLGNLLEAKNQFKEVVKIDPSSPVAQSAWEFLAQLDIPVKKAKRWDLTFSTAYQYDSNVALLSGGSELPSGISRKGDNRVLFYGRGGYQFFDTQDWSLGAAYSLYQSHHAELHSFNVQNHQTSAFLLYQQPSLKLRIPYEFNFVLVGGNTFLRSHTVTPILTIPESSKTFTVLLYGFTSHNFMNTPQFSNNDDRDGVNHKIGIAQSVMLFKTVQLAIRYDYDREFTGKLPTQEDWAYQGHKFTGDLVLSLPLMLALDFEAYDYLQFYDNSNSYSPSLEKRTDHIHNYTATLSKTFHKGITASVQYLYNRNASNISAFDYDRDIVSLILTGTF